MSSFTLNTDAPKEELVQIRCTKNEKARLKREAKNRQISLTELIRKALNFYLIQTEKKV